MPPRAAVIPGTSQRRLKRVLISTYSDEWLEFQKKYGKGQVSARLRELVREDLTRA